MKKNKFISEIKKNFSLIDEKKVDKIITMLMNIGKANKVMLAGNGASASISSHLSIDLTKAAGIKAINFNEANLLTCFSNDYGYKNWIRQAVKFYGTPNDILILISSSGQSKNVINAAKFAKKNKIKVVTFSGFLKSNPLKKLGNYNFHVNSKNYNVIESMHLVMLLSIVEKIIDLKNKKLPTIPNKIG